MPEGPTELFFRPDSLACERLTIPAALYNRCRLALARCPNDHVFVPVALADAAVEILQDLAADAERLKKQT